MKFSIGDVGRIGVLMGGYSSEREISLKSGRAIYQALSDAGCETALIDIVGKNEKEIVVKILDEQVNLAFIALHGRLGEDGTIQTILEDLEIKYTGSGIEASVRAFDKSISQKEFKNHGISVPPFITLRKEDHYVERALLDQLESFPVVVKPAREGSSIGITIVNNEEDFQAALKLAKQFDDIIIVEKYIKGKEFTVGILGQKALSVVEICPRNEYFDYSSKYEEGMTEYSVPALISEDLTHKLQKTALEAHQLLGCKDFSRVDYIVDEAEHVYLLELNTIPGFTSTSLLPKAAKEASLSFQQLCLKIIELAYGKKKETKNISIRG